MLKTPIESGYFSSSVGFGSNAISSGVKSRVIVSPVMASWNVPCGFDIIYFLYPYTIIVPPVMVPVAGEIVKPVEDVVELM